MADKNKIGEKYHFTWLVEEGKIRELTQAINGDISTYQYSEMTNKHKATEIVVPLTFTTVAIMWTGTLFQAFDDLGMKLSNIMHAAHEYEYFHDVLPGDNLNGIMEIKTITEKQGKSGSLQFIDFETIIKNQNNEIVLKEKMGVVEKN